MSDYATTPELYMFFYSYVFHNITVSALICLCMLYKLIIRCTSSWEFSYISLQFMGYSTTASSLHMHLYLYVCEYYTYTFYKMFVYFIKYNHPL